MNTIHHNGPALDLARYYSMDLDTTPAATYSDISIPTLTRWERQSSFTAFAPTGYSHRGKVAS